MKINKSGFLTMDQLVTLIIILHNRHQNLERLLDYYKNTAFPIVVADSSREKHCFASEIPSNVTYLFTPNITYTQKIEQTLATINTPYVVMCADDDFIIPNGIMECVCFLEKNKVYAVAQGTSICFIKKSITAYHVDFRALYNNISYDIETDDPFERLNKMFYPYRSNLYAVHRTDNLKLAFTNTGNIIKSLFLNEFLTVAIPIAIGKYKELPILFSVREFAEDSDDKTSINLYNLVVDEEHQSEFAAFLDHQSNILASILHTDKLDCNNLLKKIFLDFVNELKKSEVNISRPSNKRLGNLIAAFPIVGKPIIKKYRSSLYKKSIEYAIKTNDDKKALKKIGSLLIQSVKTFGKKN